MGTTLVADHTTRNELAHVIHELCTSLTVR